MTLEAVVHVCPPEVFTLQVVDSGDGISKYIGTVFVGEEGAVDAVLVDSLAVCPESADHGYVGTQDDVVGAYAVDDFFNRRARHS